MAALISKARAAIAGHHSEPRHDEAKEGSRFDKLRQSPNRKDLHAASFKSYHAEPAVMEIPAEKVVLTESQESNLKDEAFARGGFINHLDADFDLQHRSHMPPLQARFESSFIYMPDEELVKRITLELQREYPHLHIGEQAAPAASSSIVVPLKQGRFIDQHSAPLTASVPLKQGQGFMDNRSGPHMTAKPRPEAHLLPQLPEYYRKASADPSIQLDEPRYNHHTDYYHLAADYDLHRRSHLPPLQARFESSFIYMPDEALAKRIALELQAEYPHLRPAEDVKVEHHPHGFCGIRKFW